MNGDKDRKRFENKNGEFTKIRWLKHMIKYYDKEKDTYPLQVLCSNCHTKITAEFRHSNKKEPDADQISLTNFLRV